MIRHRDALVEIKCSRTVFSSWSLGEKLRDLSRFFFFSSVVQDCGAVGAAGFMGNPFKGSEGNRNAGVSSPAAHSCGCPQRLSSSKPL